MYTTIKNKLFSKNMTQLVKDNTREQQILDHIYTNKVNKIQNVIIKDDSYSDHSILILIRSMKINKVEENLFLSRNINNVDFIKLENSIFNNTKYNSTLSEKNTNQSAENIINIILDEYDIIAPPKKIKIHNNEKETISKSTNILINNKNLFYKNAYSKK